MTRSSQLARSSFLCLLLVVGLLSFSANSSPGAAATANWTMASVTFDDGLLNQFINARPVLLSKRIEATFYIISDVMGQSGYMSPLQIHQLASDGDEIGNHTQTHRNLTLLSPSDVQ